MAAVPKSVIFHPQTIEDNHHGYHLSIERLDTNTAMTAIITMINGPTIQQTQEQDLPSTRAFCSAFPAITEEETAHMVSTQFSLENHVVDEIGYWIDIHGSRESFTCRTQGYTEIPSFE